MPTDIRLVWSKKEQTHLVVVTGDAPTVAEMRAALAGLGEVTDDEATRALAGWFFSQNHHPERGNKEHMRAALTAAFALRTAGPGEVTEAERLAGWISAALSSGSFEEGYHSIMLGKGKEHEGDCTSMPWTCVRCVYDRYIDYAQRALAALRTASPPAGSWQVGSGVFIGGTPGVIVALDGDGFRVTYGNLVMQRLETYTFDRASLSPPAASEATTAEDGDLRTAVPVDHVDHKGRI